MMSIKVSHVLTVLSVVVLLMVEVQQTAAQPNCSLTELVSCLPVITSGQDPSKMCCDKLKEQEPCFCQYLRLSNPAYKPYIDSPNARKVASFCAVTIPTC